MRDDRVGEFRDDYLWDMEHGFIEEAENLIDEDEDEDEDDWRRLDRDAFEISELEDAGIDIDEFEMMDDDERRESLIDAGLDPDEYDFL